MPSQLVIAKPQHNDNLQVAAYKLAYYLMTAAGTASPTNMLLPSMVPNYNDSLQWLMVKAAYWASQITGGGGGALLSGAGSPLGVVAGSKGQRYFDTAGGTFYTNTDGTLAGWVVG